MKKLFVIILLVSAFQAMGQKTESVTVTVSGTGSSSEEAKLNALRSAIEQSFGVFISSSSEILGDKLSKDDISVISSGSVQRYIVVSEVKLPDNKFAITLNATVSLNKLVDLCSSKGVSVKVNGNLFVTNVKIQRLNEEAELRAVQNLCKVSWDILSQSVDFKITVEKPTIIDQNNNQDDYNMPITVSYFTNKNKAVFADYFIKTLNSLNMPKSEVESYCSQNRTVCILQVDNNSFIHLRNLESAKSIIKLAVNANIFLFKFRVMSDVDELSVFSVFNTNRKEFGRDFYPTSTHYYDTWEMSPYDIKKRQPIFFAGDFLQGIKASYFHDAQKHGDGKYPFSYSNMEMFLRREKSYDREMLSFDSEVWFDEGMPEKIFQPRFISNSGCATNGRYYIKIDPIADTSGEIKINHRLPLKVLEKISTYKVERIP